MGKFIKKFETHSEYETYILGNSKVLPNVSLCEDLNELHYNAETRIIAKFNVTSTSVATSIINSNSTSQFSKIEIDNVVQPSVVSSYTFDTTGEHTIKYTLVDLTIIDNWTFSSCSELISVTIPNTITTIGQWVFNNCYALESVNIPNNVTSIGTLAFYNCYELLSITIPNSVTSIGNSAFGGCRGLTSLKVEGGNTVYDSRNNCNAIIETATNTLISGCKNTVIPNSVTSIGSGAFGTCTNLTSVTIPSGVTSIGSSAFSGCSNLSSIICNATTAPTIANNTFRNVKTSGTLTVPSGSTGYDVWMGTGNYYLGKYNWTKVEQ